MKLSTTQILYNPETGMIRRGYAADAHELLEKALCIGLAAIETEDQRQQLAAHSPAKQELAINRERIQW